MMAERAIADRLISIPSCIAIDDPIKANKALLAPAEIPR
jgi:hypothetical protein